MDLDVSRESGHSQLEGICGLGDSQDVFGGWQTDLDISRGSESSQLAGIPVDLVITKMSWVQTNRHLDVSRGSGHSQVTHILVDMAITVCDLGIPEDKSIPVQAVTSAGEPGMLKGVVMAVGVVVPAQSNHVICSSRPGAVTTDICS